MLARHFGVEITENLFNFITASFSKIVGCVKCFSFAFDYTRMFVGRFNYRNIRIKIFTCDRKRLRFWYVQIRYHLREKLNVSWSSSSLDVVLSSSTKLIFSLFDEFWSNNGRIVLSRNFIYR